MPILKGDTPGQLREDVVAFRLCDRRAREQGGSRRTGYSVPHQEPVRGSRRARSFTNSTRPFAAPSCIASSPC
jgi:hypothetical protein